MVDSTVHECFSFGEMLRLAIRIYPRQVDSPISTLHVPHLSPCVNAVAVGKLDGAIMQDLWPRTRFGLWRNLSRTGLICIWSGAA